MGKLISHLHLSLDGFAAGTNREMDWIVHHEDLFRFVKTITDRADTAMYGRITWQMMDNYWPSAADKPGATEHDKEHAAWYKRVDKFVLSRTRHGSLPNKVNFVGGDLGTEIDSLKRTAQRDILLLGSPSVVRALMKLNLIDEYWIFLNPVILGNGIPVFAKDITPIMLKKKDVREFSGGVTALQFGL